MPRSPLTAAGILLAALALAAVLVERRPEWRRLREISGSRSVPGGAVGSTRFGRALRELDLLHAVPRGRRPGTPAASLGAIPARRGSIPDQLSLGRPGGSHLLASYGLRDVELARRAPVVSLLVPPRDLDEMHRSTYLRGRESEHPAWVGLFEEGRLVFGSGAGVRIHGGASRARRSWLSYRLTARQGYDGPVFSPAPFPADPDPEPRQLVLRANRGVDGHGHMWHFSSPAAMDVARRVGVPVPRSRPVAFFLNGSYEGVYELTDYLGRQLVRERFGIDRMVLVRTKRNVNEGERSKVKEGPAAPYEELRRRLQALAQDTPAKRGRVGEWVDLDNLYRWAIAVTFLDTRDAFQGALVRDLDDPTSRWFWIGWDLEISFGLGPRLAGDTWRVNRLRWLLTTRRPDERRRLVQWLLEDPEERRRFLALAVEALNHRIDAAFLEERVAFYRAQAELFGIEERYFLDELADYLERRPGAYRDQLRQELDAGPSHRVRISGPPGSRLEIDGHPTELPWSGEYFDGMTLRLAGPAGSELRLGGEVRRLGQTPLELTLDGDREIALLPAT